MFRGLDFSKKKHQLLYRPERVWKYIITAGSLPSRGQIILSEPKCSEIWIFSTSTIQFAHRPDRVGMYIYNAGSLPSRGKEFFLSSNVHRSGFFPKLSSCTDPGEYYKTSSQPRAESPVTTSSLKNTSTAFAGQLPIIITAKKILPLCWAIPCNQYL